MKPQERSKTLLREVYKTSLQSCKNNPTILIPFIIFAVFEFLSLIIIFLAPRMPLKLILGPFIRTFWGERFLHYPFNFLLLPKLASLCRMGLTIVLGSLLTGMAVVMASDIYNKKSIKLGASFKSALKKYINLFFIVLFFIASFYGLIRIVNISVIKYFIAGHTKLLFLGHKIWTGPILLCTNFIIAVLFQSLFIYAIPILIIEKEKLLKSIIMSFVTFRRLFLSTIILVGLPMLIYLPEIILNYDSGFLIDKTFPEIVLLVSILGVILNSLIIDPLITISLTFLYLLNKENK